jgi:PmbA protein
MTNPLSHADAYEVLESDGISLSVSFENDRLNEISQAQNAGVSARVVKDGRIGFSYSSKPGDRDQVAANALRLAPFGKPYDFKFAGRAGSVFKAPFDPACGELNPEELIALGEKLRAQVKELAPEAMFEGSFGGGLGRSRVLTSEGQDCEERHSSFSYSVLARYAEEGNFLYTYRYRSGHTPFGEADMLADARAVAEEFNAARKVVPLPAGSYPVLFAPQAFCDLLMPINVSADGQNIARKTSRFVDALGEKLFDERLTLTDDPHLADGPGSGAFDGEGVPTRERAIVEKGVLRGFVHTLATAAKCGHEPTGNARRSVSTQPMPGVHNLVMEPGDEDVAALMARAEGGLCVTQMLGTFTSNFLAGQVSGNLSLGFLVKDGRYAGRVKNCALNVNGFDMLKSRILGISKQRRWVGSQLLPWVLLEAVPISAR